MQQFTAYKHHFALMLYIVVFIIFFGLSMYLITGASLSGPVTQTIEAESP